MNMRKMIDKENSYYNRLENWQILYLYNLESQEPCLHSIFCFHLHQELNALPNEGAGKRNKVVIYMDFLFFAFWKSIIRRNIPEKSKWIDVGYGDVYQGPC